MRILAHFNTFSRSWKPIFKFNTFLILSIPRGDPVNFIHRLLLVSLKIAAIVNLGATVLDMIYYICEWRRTDET